MTKEEIKQLATQQLSKEHLIEEYFVKGDFYLGDEFPEWNGNLLITSLKYKMLIKIALKEHKVKTELIILKDKIGRIRDVDINSKGEIFLITDEKNSSIWKLTKTEKLKITDVISKY